MRRILPVMMLLVVFAAVPMISAQSEQPVEVVRQIRWHADGRVFAAARQNGMIDIVDGETLQVLVSLPAEPEGRPVIDAEWRPQPESMTLANGRFDGSIQLWDATSGTNTATYEVFSPNDSVVGVSWHPDGDLIAGFSAGGRLAILNVETGEVSLQGQNLPQTESGEWSPDGSKIARTGGNDVVVEDAFDGTPLGALSHEGGTVVDVAWSPIAESNRLASGGISSVVSLWDTETYTIARNLRGHDQFVHKVRFNDAGTKLASMGSDGRIIVWDVLTTDIITAFTPSSRPTAIDWQPGGDTLVFSNNDGEYVFVEIDRYGASPEPVVTSFALSPSGDTLALGYSDTIVVLEDAATRTPFATLEGHMYSATGIGWLLDETVVITASIDSTIRFWDAEDGAELRAIDVDGTEFIYPITAFAVSADGTQAVMGNTYGAVWQWDAAEDVFGFVTASTDRFEIENVSVNANGTRITFTDYRTTIKDLVGYQEIELEAGISDATWRYAGDTLVTGTVDGEIQIRDGVTGAIQDSFGDDRYGYIFALAWRPGYEQIAVSYQDGYVRLWDVEGETITAEYGPGVESATLSWDAAGEQLAYMTADREVVIVRPDVP